LSGGLGAGVGAGTGGGPGSTQPSRAGVEGGRRGPNANHPRPATITSALPTTSALMSPGIAANMRPGETERARRGEAGSTVGTAASSSARARGIPQWHTSARSGTRRPQVGHVQECEPISATASS
jgi:hypothetical protein